MRRRAGTKVLPLSHMRFRRLLYLPKGWKALVRDSICQCLEHAVVEMQT